MKWKNPGHEFDGVYEEMCAKEEFYFFGAGDYGKQFYPIMKHEIAIKGYIDNDAGKHGTKVNGLPCQPLAAIPFMRGKTGIIVTVSQMARSKIVEQLKAAGYRQNQDFFIIEEFLSVYFVYKYGKVYLSSVSFLPSTICNLKCKACLNFNPYAKEFYVRDWAAIHKDIDLFFRCVDRVMLFHVSGGEPMLYKHIADVIEYLAQNYGDRIDTLRTVTNGTIVPDDAILERLSRCNVEITVDDYREAVPQYRENFDALLKKLDAHGIRYYTNYTDEWIDLAPMQTDLSHLSEEALVRHFDSCCQSWQELRDGKLFSCNYSAYAGVAGISEIAEDETFDLAQYDDAQKKELVEFRLRYSKKGYVSFCRKCRGFGESNSTRIPSAEQME